MTLKKFVQNHMVSFTLVLPNLAISGLGQSFFLLYLHWTGLLAVLSWAICAGLGFEYGVIFSILTKSNFKVGKYHYHYSPEK